MTFKQSRNSTPGLSRRMVLQGAAAGATVLATPYILRAASHGGIVRHSMTSPEGLEQMKTYRRAVDTMLSLDASDPHNWHRYALIHLMDCPHMNWWFFVWHRPYTGHFERIIRIYGEDPNFALPFWDWSAKGDKRVPATMLLSDNDPDNPLDPRSRKFPEWDEFEDKYHDVVEKQFDGFDDAQRAQLKTRGYPDFDSFWTGDPVKYLGVKPNFTNDRSRARSKTFEAPDLTGSGLTSVQFDKYRAGLTTHNFVTTHIEIDGKPVTIGGLNTAETDTHHGDSQYGSLVEGQPHNLVHNNLGFSADVNYGWMPSLLSPVDPIFFMHHCNVDRLWDIWTRRQELNNRSASPNAEQAKKYNPEAFLFYVDENKQPAPTTAGASTDINPEWGYSYADGTGSDLVRMDNHGEVLMAARSGGLGNVPISNQAGGAISVAIPSAMAMAVPQDETHQVAHITIDPPRTLRGVRFDVFITPKGEQPDVSRDSVEFAGSAEFFGMGHSHGRDLGFSIDISEALDRLEAAGALQPGEAFDIAVITARGEDAGSTENGAPQEATLKSVSIETTSSG